MVICHLPHALFVGIYVRIGTDMIFGVRGGGLGQVDNQMGNKMETLNPNPQPIKVMQ